MSHPDNIRRELSQALDSVSADNARMVRDEDTEIEEHPAPFLNTYKIYQIEHFLPSRPVMFYVGFAPGKQAYMLTGSMDNYVEMAKADPVTIDSPDMAAEYVTVAVEVTRSMSRLVYIVRSVDEIKFQKMLERKEQKVKQKFIEEFGSRIQPPYAEPMGEGYHVTVYVAQNKDMQRYSAAVSRGGDIEVEVTNLQSNLPLLMGR